MNIVGLDVAKLRKAYEAAVKDGRDGFEYKGHWLVTTYAKYLLEFLEGPARV